MKNFLVMVGILAIAAAMGPAAAQSHKSSRDVAPAIYAPPDEPTPAVAAPVQPEPAAPPPSIIAIPQIQQTQATPSPSGSPAEDEVQVPFDFQSFCTSPASDGTPRSPVWTESCMASAGATGVHPAQAPAR